MVFHVRGYHLSQVSGALILHTVLVFSTDQNKQLPSPGTLWIVKLQPEAKLSKYLEASHIQGVNPNKLLYWWALWDFKSVVATLSPGKEVLTPFKELLSGKVLATPSLETPQRSLERSPEESLTVFFIIQLFWMFGPVRINLNASIIGVVCFKPF